MHTYTQIYEFAASAGALEGYVYQKDRLDEQILEKWCKNLVNAYRLLPPDVLKEFQPACDGTLGRAIRSMIPVLGVKHPIVEGVQSMVTGQLPQSPDDFQKEKWFQK
jgi:hypothetical protein